MRTYSKSSGRTRTQTQSRGRNDLPRTYVRFAAVFPKKHARRPMQLRQSSAPVPFTMNVPFCVISGTSRKHVLLFNSRMERCLVPDPCLPDRQPLVTLRARNNVMPRLALSHRSTVTASDRIAARVAEEIRACSRCTCRNVAEHVARMKRIGETGDPQILYKWCAGDAALSGATMHSQLPIA